MSTEFTGSHEMDARVWARNFCKRNPTIDEGLMIGWFANAVMAGHDVATAVKDKEIRRIEMDKQSLEEALEWYEKRVNLCNMHGFEGEGAREELANDRGRRARETIEKFRRGDGGGC